jgi:OFA family oxalate/formate antiporter-like MFS transporter
VKKKYFYGYTILFFLFILHMTMYSPRGSFGVFIKPLSSEFDWSRSLIAGAFSASSLIQGFSGIIMGWLNDRLGPRIVLTICGVLLGSGLMLMYWVDSVWQLYLFYVVPIGFGMGGIYAPQMSTAARWFAKRRNLVIGIVMAGGGLGGLISPPLITWLIYTYSWREAFLFVGTGVFFLVILSAQFLKRDPAVIGQVAYGQETGQTIKEPSSVFGLSVKQALQTKKFWILAFVIFCNGFCSVTILVHIVPYAIDRGFSPESAALILSFMNIAIPVGSIIMGLIADKIGGRKVFITSVTLLLTIIFLLLPIKVPLLLGLVVAILSFGSGGVAVMQSSLVADLFGMKSHGAVLGCIIFTLVLGGAAGTYIAGSIFDSTGGYQWVFSLCGILIILAIIMALYLNRIRKNILDKV